MRQANRTRLYFGPYKAPPFKVGQVVRCSIQGPVTIGGVSKGKIPWPRVRRSLVVTQDVAAVRQVDGKRQLALLRWGLIPSWAKDVKIGASGINARADTVATKPMFRTAYKRRWLKVGNLGRFFLR